MSKVINNFAGLNGYIWWMGVVEGREADPLQLGRCRVRIFGWHTDNKQLIPTKDLPWALPVLPSNNSKSFTTPVEGDYVTGFFADSESGQFPIMLGVLPGIVTPNGAATETTVATVSNGFIDPRKPEEIAAAPKPPTGQVQKSVNQPTTAPLARGQVANTALSVAAANRSHNCDTVAPFTLAIAQAQYDVMKNIKLIGEKIAAAFGADQATPILEQVKAAITAVTNQIKEINRILKPIINLINQILSYIKQLKQIIQYILSLPAKLIAYLSDCLKQAQAQVAAQENALNNIDSTTSTSLTSTIKNLTTSVSQLSSTVNTIKNTVNVVPRA